MPPDAPEPMMSTSYCGAAMVLKRVEGNPVQPLRAEPPRTTACGRSRGVVLARIHRRGANVLLCRPEETGERIGRLLISPRSAKWRENGRRFRGIGLRESRLDERVESIAIELLACGGRLPDEKIEELRRFRLKRARCSIDGRLEDIA